MPKKFPPEFKRDVVTVARRGDLTVAEVAADFDISPESVRRWMRQADVDEASATALPPPSSPSWCSCAATSAAWRWKTRSSAGPRHTSPRTPSQNDVPAGP